jgi:4-amino-4-deoxy-L-arabinose transferase-like glycosyltransferase
VALWVLALGAFALWSRRPLLREGLWTDEAISVYVAAAPSPSEFLARNQTSDYTPPLFNALLAGYMRLAGSGEAALKAFAMIWGLLALAAAAALAGQVGGPVAAAVAAAWLVNNPILIDMSAELRSYSLSAFLACVALLAVFRLRRRGEASGAAFVGLAVLLALLVYAHVAGGIVIGVMLVWGVLEARRAPSRPFGRRLALSAAAALAAFLFWLPTTFRQARVGLPWEKKLTLGEAIRASAMQTAEALPIPGAFGQPVFVLGLAVLLTATIRLWRPLRDRLRSEREPLVVLSTVAAAIWVILGLYTRQSSRYLIIPAVLAAVVVACVLASAFKAATRPAPPFVRAAVAAGIASLVVSAFWARIDMYEGRFEVAARPKSGFRTLCQARMFEPGELAIVVPDYLAPTAWYYCGRDEKLRGFVRWEHPFLFDPRRNRELWSDPEAARQAVSRIDEALRREERSSFLVLSEETAAGLLPLFAKPVDDFRAELTRSFDVRAMKRFPARVESVRAEVWVRRAL